MKKKTAVRISFGIIAVVILLGFIFSAFITSQSSLLKNRVSAESAPAFPGTSARAMCTLEMNTGRVLYAKNEDARLPMASTTKIVTAIAAIEAAEEQGLDIDAKIRVDDKAIGVEGTSIYLQKDEKLSIRELLYGLMLRSGNDAAMALALAVDKSNEDFCGRMSAVSKKAGAVNSSYKNPHGLDCEGHYTTAKDLSLITAYALKNPVFAEIVKTTQTRIDGKEYPRILQNKNRLLRQLDGCIGVKTGFTKKAGRCYVGACNADGMTLVCTVLNCGPMFEEAAELMTLGTEEYSMTKLIGADEFINLTGSGGESRIQAIGTQDFYYPVKTDGTDKVDITLDGEHVSLRVNNKLVCIAECNVL